MADLCRKIFSCCGGTYLHLLPHHHHGRHGHHGTAPTDRRAHRLGRSKVDYDNVLADSEREAVADLLSYLENVRYPLPQCFDQRCGKRYTIRVLTLHANREPRPTSSPASPFERSRPSYTARTSTCNGAPA
jgi:hypothetical protein